MAVMVSLAKSETIHRSCKMSVNLSLNNFGCAEVNMKEMEGTERMKSLYGDMRFRSSIEPFLVLYAGGACWFLPSVIFSPINARRKKRFVRVNENCPPLSIVKSSAVRDGLDQLQPRG